MKNFSKCRTYFALNFFIFFLIVYFVMKCWENEFQSLHTFDPGGGGGVRYPFLGLNQGEGQDVFIQNNFLFKFVIHVKNKVKIFLYFAPMNRRVG